MIHVHVERIFFFNARARGILCILQSDWLWERAEYCEWNQLIIAVLSDICLWIIRIANYCRPALGIGHMYETSTDCLEFWPEDSWDTNLKCCLSYFLFF